MNLVLSLEGHTKWWLYTVSHRQLLLRRLRVEPAVRRVDVLFKDVMEVHLFPVFVNLKVFEVGVGDADLPVADLKGRRFFRFIADNAVGFVIAGAIACHEDDLEYYDPSALLDENR